MSQFTLLQRVRILSGRKSQKMDGENYFYSHSQASLPELQRKFGNYKSGITFIYYLLIKKNFISEMSQIEIQKYLGLTPVEELIFQEKTCSLQTLPGESFSEIYRNISQIKNVKVGRRRLLKLVQQNAKNLLKEAGPKSRRLAKKQTIDEDQTVIYESCSTTVSKNKKLIKKSHRSRDGHIKRIRRNKLSDKSMLEKTIESESLIEQGIKQGFNFIKCKGIKLNSNIAEGGIGFCTLIFEQPIIEGAYYLEFKILEQIQNSGYKNPSDIRVGACGFDHKLDTPLGYGDSIGYSMKGNDIVNMGKRQSVKLLDSQNKSISNGDIFGILLNFSPPYRHPNQDKIWQDSSLSFFVNGKNIGSYCSVKQMFYHPAVTLYNGARVEMRTRASEMSYMPQNCVAYEKISEYINIYK